MKATLPDVYTCLSIVLGPARLAQGAVLALVERLAVRFGTDRGDAGVGTKRLAEITLGVQVRQAAAWETARNAATTTVSWCFITVDARIKPKHPYPSFAA